MSTNPLADKLKGHIPDFVHAQLTQVSFDGMTPLRLAHFLAQCDHESQGFTRTEENLKYTKLERIVQIFRHDVDTNRDRIISQQELDHAKRYVGNPEKLANFVYANQNGNGNEASGDGWKFKGRGFIQLTGRDNYNRAGLCLGVDFIKNPEFVSQGYALTVALWFFKSNKIWDKCDIGATEQAVKEVTRRVNGGTIGLDERIKLFNKYWAIISK